MGRVRRTWLVLGVIVLLAIVIVAALPVLRSGERATLGPAARAELGGTYVALSDGVTHYEQTGPADAPVVVLVHGFSVPFYIWDPTFDALARAGYRAIRYDQYGRGFSDRPRVTYDRALFVRQLGELLDSLRVREPVSLIGLSMGGKIVPAFAADHPERVARVVLVDPASGAADLGPARYPILGDWLIRTFAVPGMAEGQTSDFLHPDRFPDWVERYRVQMRYRGFGRAIASSIRHFGVHDPSADMAALRARDIPVLVVWGEQDPTTPIAAAPRVVALTGAELLRVDSAGHLPHLERPDTVHAAILRFLERTGGRAGAAALAVGSPAAAQEPAVTRYVRFEHDAVIAWGVLGDGSIRVIDGDLFGEHRITDRGVPLAAVRLLPPTDARKVIAVGLNYRSHLGNREPAAYPGLFAKYPTSLVGHEAEIVLPEDATNVHYEGEMVLVIGRRCSRVSRDQAMDCVFGVTAGNDVSERAWQAADLQWFRAKASDTFGPVGPAIATGLDPDDLLVQTRVNGETRQSERTSDLIFDTREIVSYISRYIRLEPGDLIFTGTPQTTRALRPGDRVEVEVEGVGVLRNTVVQR